MQDLLPGIINQLGPDNLANLKKIAESYSQKVLLGLSCVSVCSAQFVRAPLCPGTMYLPWVEFPAIGSVRFGLAILGV